MEQVPESSHQTSNFGRNQYIGTLNLSQSALPRIVSPIQPRRAQYSPLQLSLAKYSPVEPSTAYTQIHSTRAHHSPVQCSRAKYSPVHPGNPHHPGHFDQPHHRGRLGQWSPWSPWSRATIDEICTRVPATVNYKKGHQTESPPIPI